MFYNKARMACLLIRNVVTYASMSQSVPMTAARWNHSHSKQLTAISLRETTENLALIKNLVVLTAKEALDPYLSGLATKKDLEYMQKNTDIKFASLQETMNNMRKNTDIKFTSLQENMDIKFASLQENSDTKFASLQETMNNMQKNTDTKFMSLTALETNFYKFQQDTSFWLLRGFGILILSLGGYIVKESGLLDSSARLFQDNSSDKSQIDENEKDSDGVGNNAEIFSARNVF